MRCFNLKEPIRTDDAHVFHLNDRK